MTKVTEYTLFERYSNQDHFTVTFASKQEVEFSQRAEYYCLWSRLDGCREWPKRNSEVCFPDTLNASRSQLKNRKENAKKSFAWGSGLRPTGSQICWGFKEQVCSPRGVSKYSKFCLQDGRPSSSLGTTRCVSQGKLPRKVKPHM